MIYFKNFRLAAKECVYSFVRMASSKSFIKANSQTELAGLQVDRKLDRLDSLRGSVSDIMSEDTFGPLSNVR